LICHIYYFKITPTISTGYCYSRILTASANVLTGIANGQGCK
jgi:hypothetical protein